jgi:hypothetical protein
MDESHFAELSVRWQRDSRDKSLTEIEAHPAFIEMLRADQEVLPLVLKELFSEREPFIGWLSLLTAITGEDPALGALDVRVAVRKWRVWARRQMP